jgi:hypothetical protein
VCRRTITVALLLGLGFILINLIGLDRTPVVNIDEVTLNDAARELAFHGHLYSSILANRPGAGADFWQPPFQPLVTAACYRLFGFGIWQTRIPSVLFGGGVVALIYVVASQLLGPGLGALVAAIIFGLDPLFIFVTRIARMDPQCMFFELLGLSLLLAYHSSFIVHRSSSVKNEPPINIDDHRYSDSESASIGVPEEVRREKGEERNSPFTLHPSPFIILSGLCVGLAGATHPIAVSWAIALGILVVVRRPSSVVRRPSVNGQWSAVGGSEKRQFTLLTFAVFCALPPLLWFIFTRLTPSGFIAQSMRHGSPHLASGTILQRLVSEFSRYSHFYRTTPLIPLAYAASVVFLLSSVVRRPSSVVRRSSFIVHRYSLFVLSVLFAVTFLFNSLVMSKGNVGLYFLHPNMILAIMTGMMFEALFVVSRSTFIVHRSSFPVRRFSSIVACSALVLLIGNAVLAGLGGRFLLLAGQWRERDYSRVAAQVASVVPRGSVVCGTYLAWYAAEEAGISLYTQGLPDAGVHDYAILRVGPDTALLHEFRKVAEIGRPENQVGIGNRESGIGNRSEIPDSRFEIPSVSIGVHRWFQWFAPPFVDYWMTIWQSNLLHPDTADYDQKSQR